MPREFSFVNSTGAQLNSEGRKFVRGHAMREYRRKHKYGLLSGNGTAETSWDQFEPQATNQVQSSADASASSEMEVQFKPQLRPSLPVNLDHFLPLPRDSLSTETVAALMHHYFHTYANTMFPADGLGIRDPFMDIWFPFTISSPAIFYATLCVAAAHLASIGGEKNDILATFLRTETLHLINDRLRNEAEALSDATIGAVLSLANSECIAGDMEICALHIQGLRQIVKLRGGLQSLQSNLVVSKMIFWQPPRGVGDGCFFDMFCRSVVGSPVNASNATLEFMSRKPENTQYGKLSSEISNLEFGSMIPMLHMNYNHELIELYQEIQSITILVDSYHSNATSNSSVSTLTNAINRVQDHLLSLCPEPDGTSHRTAFTQAPYLGASLFLVTILPSFLTFAPMVTTTRKKLYDIVASGTIDWEHSLDLLLWLLFMGGTSTVCRFARPWYTNAIRKLVVSRGIRTYDDVKIILKRWFWLDYICDKLCRRIWEEAMLEAACDS